MKWGKIGAPRSAKRKRWMRKVAKSRKKRKSSSRHLHKGARYCVFCGKKI